MIADLNATSDLRHASEKLKTPRKTTKSSVVPDSEIYLRQQILDNSWDELDYKTPRNTGERLMHKISNCPVVQRKPG